MMSRQHGAILYNGTMKSNDGKNESNKTNRNEQCSTYFGNRDEVLDRLKVLRDTATLKSWRNGITGKIKFSVKIQVVNEEEGRGKNRCVQKQSVHMPLSDSEACLPISPVNPLNVAVHCLRSCDAAIDSCNTKAATDSTIESAQIHSKTGVLLCLEVERCYDLKASNLPLFRRGGFFQVQSMNTCPFILIKVNNQEVGRTPALKNTNNPIWIDECFEFPVCDKCNDLTLEVWEEVSSPKHSFDHRPVVKETKKECVGDFIGKCNVNIQSIINRRNQEDDYGYQNYVLELKRWHKSNNKERNRCSCPLQHDIQSKCDSLYRETIRVQPKQNSFRRKRKRLGSILVEKPKFVSETINNSFRIKNNQPFRRKDIRDMDEASDSESFTNSTYFKAFSLMMLYLLIGVIGYSYIFESWTIRDSIYFSVVTFSTVGYGDIRPSNDASKLFTCIFALMGIGIIGIALGFIGQNLVQAQVEALQRSHKKKETEESDNSEQNTKSSRVMRSLPILRDVFLFICPIAAMTIIGSVIFGTYENWDLVDSVYWCVMTGTSVGYGDLAPQTNQMRWFSVPFIPLSVGVISAALGRIANIFVEEEIAKANSKLLQREVTLEDLEAMNADGDGEVSPLEFIEHMLKVMHKVDQHLLDELHAQFEKLDADGSGGLQQDDLDILTERKLEERRNQALKRYQRSLLHNEPESKAWASPQIVPCG